MEKIGTEITANWIQSEKPLRVYLACSMTCEGERRLRDKLLRACEKLLPEYGMEVYNPVRHTAIGSPHYFHEVYAIDHLNAMQCDLVLFIRIQPSLGMGMEAQIAADMLIPWFDAKSSDRELAFRLTPLVAGLPNPRACSDGRILFADANDFHNKLRAIVSSPAIRDRARAVRRVRDAASEVITGARIGRILRRQRLLLDVPVERLAEQVDMQSWWIESIERDPRLADGLTIIQLMRLTESLRLTLVSRRTTTGEVAFPNLVPMDEIPRKMARDVDRFLDYDLRNRQPGEGLAEHDREMLAHWQKWSNSKSHSLMADIHHDDAGVMDLVGCITAALSNLTDGERESSLKLQEEIHAAVTRIPGVTVSKPGFQPVRHEHSPELYCATLDRINAADFGIVVASPAATGVGISTQLLGNATVPCIYIIREGSPVSRMFRGIFCRRVGEIIEFGPTDDVGGLVTSLVANHLPMLRQSAARRRPICDRIGNACFVTSFDRFRIPNAFSQEEAVKEFARIPYLRGEWLQDIVDNPLRQCTMTLIQFVHVANYFGWSIDVDRNGVPCYHIPSYTRQQAAGLSDKKRMASDESLHNLISASNEFNRGTLLKLEDQLLFDAWDSYHRDLSEALVFRGGVYSKSKWSSILNAGKHGKGDGV